MLFNTHLGCPDLSKAIQSSLDMNGGKPFTQNIKIGKKHLQVLADIVAARANWAFRHNGVSVRWHGLHSASVKKGRSNRGDDCFGNQNLLPICL